jgi:hypothetical protein
MFVTRNTTTELQLLENYFAKCSSDLLLRLFGCYIHFQRHKHCADLKMDMKVEPKHVDKDTKS